MMKQIVLLSMFLTQYMISQDLAQTYSSKFDLRDAKIDPFLSDEIRKNFEDDDRNLPLKSISVDLNSDGISEKIIPNEFLCRIGFSPWFVYSPKNKAIIGEVDGNVLFINTTRENGYNVIETYCRDGVAEGIVCFFEYLHGKYTLQKWIDIHGNQIDEYFENKKSLKK